MDPTPAHHFLIPEEEVDMGDLATQSNSTMPNTTYSSITPRDERLATIEITILALIFVLALLGNSFVLLALRYRKRKTSRMHIFITHLSIADILVALLNILPQLAWDITFRFQGSDVSCRLIKYLQVMVIYLSTYILVVTAIDRYRAICHPLSSYSWTNRKSHIMVVIAWVLAAIMSLPQLGIFKMQEVSPGSEVMDCWADFQPEWTLRLYITSFSVTVFFLPSLILCVLYGRICYVLWKNVYSRTVDIPEHCSSTSSISQNTVSWPEDGCVRYKFIGKGQISVIPERNGRRYTSGRSHSVTGISRAKIKTIKLTFVVIIAYLLCWAPFVTTQMWWAFDKTAPSNSYTFVICLLLVSLNSCCNPWIYMAFSESLVQQVLPCCRKKAKRKPQDLKHHRKQKRSPVSHPKADPLGYIFGEKCNENIPLQERIMLADMRRRFSRTTSTKMSTLHRTDSKNKNFNNIISRYSREHGIIAAANVANWPCAVGSDEVSPNSTPTKHETKSCHCKKCRSAMEEKSSKKRYLTPWREQNEDKEISKGSSSSSRRKTSSQDSKGKKLKVQSDNGQPFLSCKSFSSDGGKDVEVEAKYSSV